ncbi:MAG: hypothetical protein LQ346_006272 [Caloplaca aetnensis]|nr:MAG: hypothetical protein LQ346_006272 [Caloplaca aetnensis]
MDDVLGQVAIAFEEDGVNHSVLDELKKTWQRRLTASKCASFPWDPPPVPPPMAVPPPLPSNAPRPQVPSSGSPVLSSTNNGGSGVTVKQEPSYGNHGLPNGIQPNYGNSIAQQRAAAHLQQKYGPNANLQINQLQAQAAMSNPGPQQQNPQNIQLPQQLSDQQRRALAERHRAMQMQQMQQAQQAQPTQQMHQTQQAQQRSQVSDAQTDGVAEWDDMVTHRRAFALGDPSGAYAADLTIRQQLEESSRAMEGGGLMLPLSEQPKRVSTARVGGASCNTGPRTSALKIPQVDGVGDSDEDKKVIKDEDVDNDEDEDAINSDLDDPDDDIVEEVGEENNQGQIMLCTYDKVQRVKNKWKCVLKDGVLTTSGKE